MDLEIVTQSEVRHRQIHGIAYKWNLKNVTNELTYKTEICICITDSLCCIPETNTTL